MSRGRGVRCVKGNISAGTESGACRGAELTVRGAWGRGPKGVGDVSEADSLRCMRGDVKEKGCGVGYVWADGERLRSGCGSPKGAPD